MCVHVRMCVCVCVCIRYRSAFVTLSSHSRRRRLVLSLCGEGTRSPAVHHTVRLVIAAPLAPVAVC